MLLKPTLISSDLFTYSAKTFCFIGEASELRNLKLGRVYDDSCDEGFSIVSAKTGKVAVFRLEGMNKDREGDCVSWNFKCVTPGLNSLTAVIFND